MRKIADLEAAQGRYLRWVHLGINLPEATEGLRAIENRIVELQRSVLPELIAA